MSNIITNGNKFNSILNTVGSLNQNITVLAESASVRYCQSGKVDWLNKLFDSESLRKVDNSLNKLGKDTLAYIKAHFPMMGWDNETQKVKTNKKKPTNALYRALVHPFDTDDGKAIITPLEQGFALSFKEWKDAKETVVPKTKNSPSKKQADKLADKLAEYVSAGFKGDVSQLQALAKAARELAQAADMAAAAETQGFDQSRIDELESIKPSASSKAAK